MHTKCTFLQKNLVVSKKSIIFAPQFKNNNPLNNKTTMKANFSDAEILAVLNKCLADVNGETERRKRNRARRAKADFCNMFPAGADCGFLTL